MDAIPPGAMVLNRPVTILETHRRLVLSAGAVLLLLCLAVLVLLAQRRRMLAARSELHESEQRFRVLVEHAPEAILVYDMEAGHFIEANAKAEALFGGSRAQLVGARPEDFYEGEQHDGLSPADSVAAKQAGVLRGEEQVFERVVRTFDGRRVPCEVRLVRLPAGKRRQLRASFLDISARKQAEFDLQRHRSELEQLVQERTSALTVAVRDAHSANRAKSVFLANMSHELRTPLNSVIGFSQMLAGSASLQAEQRRNLGIINRAGHHLLTLINDILELSKIEAGRTRVQLQAVDLQQLVHDLLDMVRGRAEEGGISLLVESSAIPAAVMADATKLRQVLLNLLSNAVKFAGAGGQVAVVMEGRTQGGALNITFTVRDTGSGIAPQDLNRIFEPFVQADTPRTQAGTGLGLTIAREFVRVMGGELLVRSKLGEGAEFSFTLQLEQEESVHPSGEPSSDVVSLPLDAEGSSILVVDDEEDSRILLAGLLCPLGFRVLEASSALDGMALLAREHPHVLLLDWRMPVMDGLAMARAIRSDRAGHQPRIVMLTASAFEEQRKEALDAGADEFLRKPVELRQLLAVLEQQLGIRFIRRVPSLVEPMPQARVPGRDDLARLPTVLRERLMAAVRELDMVKAGSLLDELAQADAPLAKAIRAALAAHQYQALWQGLAELAELRDN